jgi:pyruvate dehydrogenase E1 component beta subunit
MQQITYREALNQALKEEMRRDDRIIILGEDVALYGGSYKVTDGLLAEFGSDRVRDTPISEGAIVGTAIGAAMLGLRPIAELMTINFSLLAMDQIVNHAAKIRSMFGGKVNVPLVVRAPGGGGQQLGAQHSQSLESYFLHCPGLRVAIPSTPADAKGLLKESIRDANPVMFIEHTVLYGTKGEVPTGDYTIPLGIADVKKEGSDITIVGYSRMLLTALEAAKRLWEEDEIDAEVVDPRTLNPLDVETLATSVKKTRRAVIVEEDWLTGGVGAELAARISEEAFDYLDAPVRRIATKDVPLPYSRELELRAIPSVDDVVAAVRQMI